MLKSINKERKQMKKYNIKTMEKFKLKAVGADTSVHLRKIKIEII